jgi:glutathione synthase/RimK-type ligase-like ATP-grasp enzyme
MRKDFYIVVNYFGMMPQQLHETECLGVSIIRENILASEMFHSCEILSLDDLANRLMKNNDFVKNGVFYFCSSQVEEYLRAILDVAMEVKSVGGLLIPAIEFYFSHENKYYQELYKSRMEIPTPKCLLFTSSEVTQKLLSEIVLPSVVKPYNGFGSEGVQLTKTKNSFQKALFGSMKSFVFGVAEGKEILKRFVKRYFMYRGAYPSRIGRVVAQSFIPDLTHDWKVLVFYNKVYVLKRYTRKGDFRASGSGNFDFSVVADDRLIEFSVKIRKMLKAPFVSLDIAENNLGYSIIEYQTVHFGLATVINAKTEYLLEENKVLSRSISNVCIPSLFSESILQFYEEEH